jgi:hypothetical protein
MQLHNVGHAQLMNQEKPDHTATAHTMMQLQISVCKTSPAAVAAEVPAAELYRFRIGSSEDWVVCDIWLSIGRFINGFCGVSMSDCVTHHMMPI